MNIVPGLVSITFRKLSPGEIIELVQAAGLKAIEWGGDIHVPAGNFAVAKRVGDMTKRAGLRVAAYGSYYHAGCGDSDDPNVADFATVLQTAKHLGAPVIRIWAGNRASAEADEAWWDKVIGDARRIARQAAEAGIRIAFEYHGGTLTDTMESAARLLQACNENARHPVYSLWQPAVFLDRPARMESLQTMAPWLLNLHVFHWRGLERMPLSDGTEDWLAYLRLAARQPLPEHLTRHALLEFVKNDDPAQFMRDAKILQELCRKIHCCK